MLLDGVGGEKDSEQGLKLLGLAAAAGHLGAMAVIGQRRMTGYEVERRPRTARQMLKKAAQGGVASAALWLAYEYDFRPRRNPKEAVHWYRVAATLGEIPAMVNLGIAYEHGDGVRRDVRLCRLWYSRAVEAGDKGAQRNLADLKNS
jgi:TPR repeat protein